MSMMGHMGKAGYEEWRTMRREQQIDRGEIDEDASDYKRTDTDGYKVRMGGRSCLPLHLQCRGRSAHPSCSFLDPGQR